MSRREHRRIRMVIDAWIDGELHSAHASRVAAHVRDCWDCSSSAQTTRLIKHSLRHLRDREPRRLAAARLLRFAEQLARS